MFNLITIGDAVVDTHVQIDDASVECDYNHAQCKLCLDYATKVPITDSFQALGGNAANVAVGAVKLGLTASVLTSVGKDVNGRFIRQELGKQKVNTDCIFADQKSKTRYSIVLTYKGERTILSYFQKRYYKWPTKIAGVDWIYYTSLSNGFEPLQEKLFNYLYKHPTVRLAVNPGTFQLKRAMKTVREAVKRADLLIINLEEAEMICGKKMAELKTVSALIHALLLIGVKEVAITDAGRGAWAGNNEEIWHIDAYPVKVVAKAGAGDAFSSGYLAARFYGHNIPRALEWGIANSCNVIGNVGAQTGLLDKKRIEQMIAKYPSIKPAIINPFPSLLMPRAAV